MTIRYVTGDATRPEGDGVRVICHVCNDRGAWAAGFVLAVSRRWKEPERYYRANARHLGDVQFTEVAPDILVASMIAQAGFPTLAKPLALDYSALADCLTIVGRYCLQHGASLHMPRIGCGIAGGDWIEVALIIERTAQEVPVTVYDLRQGRGWKS